jgi:hypothetical protein
MRKWILSLVLVATLAGGARAASAAYYVEYYRDNLFAGLAYHRVGCMTDWYTIQSDQDYDGFTGQRYCVAGSSPESVPSASWYGYDYVGDSFTEATGTGPGGTRRRRRRAATTSSPTATATAGSGTSRPVWGRR